MNIADHQIGPSFRPFVIAEMSCNHNQSLGRALAIVEAAATGEFDAAFGWTSFQHLEPGRIEIIELPPEQTVLRGTGVGMLSFAKNIDNARKLMDFLTTPEARAFYKEFGWVLEDD